jgi:hypothetical protein
MRGQVMGLSVIMLVLLYAVSLFALQNDGIKERPRVIVLTDISNEPDDEESMVRFLVYANEFEIEGLVATTSTWLRKGTREDLIRRQIDAYELVYPNLIKHADGYPTAESLRKVTFTGQPGYGMGDVGPGKSSPGSQHIIEVLHRPDDRPVWITIWGGANTLAQALWDVKYSRTPEELSRLVKKIRVYTISDQDDSGRWMRITFPELFYIVSPSAPDAGEYHFATWTGIGGDRFYKNGPMQHIRLVENPWLEEHIINNHGPLGALYPRVEYIMEGDTPSFLGLIDNGLGWHKSPAFGGWGGRYQLHRSYAETRPIWTNNRQSRDTIELGDGRSETSDQATIWRWRQAYQHDFAARMDWCVADRFAKANHNPVVVLAGDETREIVRKSVKSGESIPLSAKGTKDPDGDALAYHWWVYKEAGSYQGEVKIADAYKESGRLTAPQVDKERTIHIICEVTDNGEPSMSAYRRLILTVLP